MILFFNFKQRSLWNSDAGPFEVWDVTCGLTIRQLYNALGANIDSFCKYEFEIINRYGLVVTAVDEIFQRNNAGECL